MMMLYISLEVRKVGNRMNLPPSCVVGEWRSPLAKTVLSRSLENILLKTEVMDPARDNLLLTLSASVL
jgi:hypothetical protein